MNVLLDTHILLWWLAADAALPPPVGDVIANPDTVVAVSAASAWEIAIKKAVGRLETPDDFDEVLDANAFDSLAITVNHALAAVALPAHHSDPFDRMLIAQARIESLVLITLDRRFSDYEVDLLPLG